MVEVEEPCVVHLRRVLLEEVLNTLGEAWLDASLSVGALVERVSPQPGGELIDDVAKHRRRIPRDPGGRQLAVLSLVELVVYQPADIVGIGVCLGLFVSLGQPQRAAYLGVIRLLCLEETLGCTDVGALCPAAHRSQ